jgi:hypothetical protein
MADKSAGEMELDEGAVKTVNLSKATRVYNFLETLATETKVSKSKTRMDLVRKQNEEGRGNMV